MLEFPVSIVRLPLGGTTTENQTSPPEYPLQSTGTVSVELAVAPTLVPSVGTKVAVGVMATALAQLSFTGGQAVWFCAGLSLHSFHPDCLLL
ncbi:hypothetical protein H9W95_11060 [Flavobacterium lindanitolerans]|nr:hypothetical protein [Flavobacterium lindanitolerans]